MDMSNFGCVNEEISVVKAVVEPLEPTVMENPMMELLNQKLKKAVAIATDIAEVKTIVAEEVKAVVNETDNIREATTTIMEAKASMEALASIIREEREEIRLLKARKGQLVFMKQTAKKELEDELEAFNQAFEDLLSL